jgi:hypothetical protein
LYQKKSMLSYKSIKNARQWKATTGLSELSFRKLRKHFALTYESKYGVSIESLSFNIGKELLLSTYEDCLFFVLFQLKNGLTYDSLGLLIHTDDSNAKGSFERYLSILEQTLLNLGMRPKRGFEAVAQLEKYFQNEAELIIDASEQATHGLQDYEAQKQQYSGKKNVIPTKN